MRRYKKYAEYPIAQLRIICLTETSLTGELRQPCVYIRNNKPPQVMQNLRRSEFVALRCNFLLKSFVTVTVSISTNRNLSLGKVDPVPLQIHFFIWLIY